MIELTPLGGFAAGPRDALLDRAFGRDRRSRTAYRLRDGVEEIASLSLAAVEAGVLVGSIQCWPVAFRADDGRDTRLVLIGPVAVSPERQQDGIGRQLMRASLDAAGHAGRADAMMLIGDPEYYGRFFGFSAERTGGWRLPGPVEPRRLLARGRDVPDGTGMIGPCVAVPAR